MIILILNCGSSSIKYQVIRIKGGEENTVYAKGLVERIGQEKGHFIHKPTIGKNHETFETIPDHTKGIAMIIDAIANPSYGVISSLNDLKAVGHRVAHGGEYFQSSAIINADTIEKIKACSALAPLHNPANLKGIKAINRILPTVPQVACFDTQLHCTIPAKNYIYALPYKYYEEFRIRRYGFHGMSHSYVAERGCEMFNIDINNSKIITLHLGNGGSATALINGKSYDTSMGFTPTDGLVMGTRCGQIDPGAIIYIQEVDDLTRKKISDVVNNQSGLLGITGISSDMRDILNAKEEGNERAALAVDMYIERIKKFVGQYAATMGGVDMIIFTGGVGENNPWLREAVCEGLEFMGIDFDTEANSDKRDDAIISKPESRVKVGIIATNEELVIATETFKLIKRRSE